MADRFYTPDPLAPGEYTLTGAEANHLSAVRRFGPGDHLIVFNGDGRDYLAEVIVANKRSATLHILRADAIDRELPFPLVVAAAIPKGDRADFLIEKLTELGVARFVPLLTSRAVVQPKVSVVEKYNRAVIEASKQCGRNRLMVIDPPRRWADFLATTDLPRARWILHTEPELPRVTPVSSEAVFAVGPEGGFTTDEVQAAIAAGWEAVSLGPRVLRMETAAIAAAAMAATAK